MSSMKARLLTAAIGVPVAVGIMVLGEFISWILYLVISILCSLMTIEILSAKKLHKKALISVPCIIFAFIEPLLINTSYKLLPVFLLVIALFFVMILKSEDIQYDKVIFALAGTFLITLGMSSILLTIGYLGGFFSFSFVIAIGVSWVADGGAYFAGVFLGKHKLCPKVSPNKTIEGFVGGLIAGTISSALIGFIYSFIYIDVHFNYLALVIIGLFGSLISVLGDLTFSLIKRSCKIKDYGSIFPGHGGILDRFDSVIFISPLIYLLCTLFPVVTV